MASAVRLANGLGAALALVVLSACVGLHQDSRLTLLPTPPDPPPLPDRRPATPASFKLAQSVPAAAPPVTVSAAQPIKAIAAQPVKASVAQPVKAIGAQPLRFTVGEAQVVSSGPRVPGPRVHEVVAGDTIYGVSRRYGADMAELARINGIAPPYSIRLGQRLIIPGPEPTGAIQTAAMQAPPVPTPAPARAPAAAPLDGAEGRLSASRAAPALAPLEAAVAGPVPDPPPLHGGKFLWPVSGPLVSPYGPKADGLHNDGVNIAAERGTPIRAAENGVVAYVGNELRGFGNLLLIKHSGDWVTAYAHTDEILVRRGERVRRGQVVARVGSSGSVAEPQLHFEVRKGIRTIDPARLLEAREVASN